ncbi:DUF4280 domain-containing protein [Paenibacillus lentus]|uniref:DUF4280 domain-containing protein n=1 Tax=Paenibacillus lentus TaxID=1338368 RepID=A0A3S8S071_9BACL|nr:DUF4280 domain-containing protein [Paenibacillus lentus]AZK48593.1 DUF4280 domain-containing protein [Paenibacillus lentus]
MSESLPNTGIFGTMLKKSLVDELMNTDWRQRETYITRGAFMYCTKGTHEDVLNQPKVNGFYINKNPIMTVNDCKVSTSVAHEGSYLDNGFEEPGTVIDGNIHSFGFCRADAHPSKLYETTYNPTVMHREFSYDFDPDQPPSGANPNLENKTFPCVPKLISSSANPLKGSAMAQSLMGGEKAEAAKDAIMDYFDGLRWKNGSETLFINGVPALTSKSCLTCAYGGEIGFLSNGMDMPPFEFVEHNLKQG